MSINIMKCNETLLINTYIYGWWGWWQDIDGDDYDDYDDDNKTTTTIV